MDEQQPEAAAADAAAEAPAPETPAAAGHAPSVSEIKPSKSNLVEKRASGVSKSQSRVRLVEPGHEQPAGEEQKKSETERRQSEAERRKSEAERRKTETERLSKELSSISYRGSKTSQRPSATQSKEGILRRRSDRPSKSRAVVGSTISIRRTSGYGEFLGGTKTAKFMNTYKLDSDNPFHVERVEKILREVLTEALDNLVYDADKCPKQAKWATSAIRARVKEQEYDRYKLVILVTIGEKKYQDMSSVVRFLWDIERDKYALFVHENMHVYAAAMCFGLYYE